MTEELREKMESYPLSYARDNIRKTTLSLNEKEYSDVRNKLCFFVRCIPYHFSPEFKVRLLYSVITKLVHYDEREKDEDNPARFTYMGCLDRQAVCMGISQMMTMLCKGLGIKAETVVGYAWSSDKDYKGGPHAWNIVWLPDRNGTATPYHLDATWDLHDESCGSSFRYYLKTDDYMKKHNHCWLKERYPVCNKEAHYNITKIDERLVNMACRVFPKMTP